MRPQQSLEQISQRRLAPREAPAFVSLRDTLPESMIEYSIFSRSCSGSKKPHVSCLSGKKNKYISRICVYSRLRATIQRGEHFVGPEERYFSAFLVRKDHPRAQKVLNFRPHRCDTREVRFLLLLLP
jgi:hypothetical protein